MWPFTREKQTEEVTADLAPEVQQFFHDANPEQSNQSILEMTPHQQRVNQVLAKHADYSSELDEYRRKNRPQLVCQINCAELQEQVSKCFKEAKYWSTDPCREQIDRAKQCATLTSDALKRMHYSDCYSVKQCDAIRFIIDRAFVNNFGRYGDEGSEDAIAKFNQELDSYFNQVWK
ncbi:hypothetical protein DIURU_003597 [Diutina rugosa]|uniref:Uncharacterized protein n=1 Tax=Diutina rugosa TaxID=5481 RepID=A0A642ULJ3_DIURU|nr:uncharacterized protein DIURU_003597 [Diutina rugosa]KAA8901227.1 hypothetical protein DIURU_003597 [Diutina rugosa]